MTEDFEKEESVLSSVDVELFTNEEVKKYQDQLESLVEVLEENEERIENALSDVNDSHVMEELGVELCLDVDYDYSTEQREVRSLGAEFEIST